MTSKPCLALVLSLSAVTHAESLLTETWEGTLTEVHDRWANTSVPGGLTATSDAFVSLSSLHPFTGTQSLRFHYFGTQYDSPPHSGGNITRSFTRPASEIWLTWYEYWAPGFKVAGGSTVCSPPMQICGAGTKNWYIRATPGTASQVPTYFWGGRTLSLGCQNCYNTPAQLGSQNFYQNQGADFAIPDNHHVCYEHHIKLNTPGVADGVSELFVQDMTAGTPNRVVTRYTGLQQRAPVSMGSNVLFPHNAQFAALQAYRQDGYGDMWKDNVSVSTTRVGCTGTPPVMDKTAPGVPNQLFVK